MIVDRFYKNLVRSGIFYFYVNVVFFSSVIFFTINDNLFTPLEAIVGIVLFTVIAKAMSNIMCAWGISFVDLSNYKRRMENDLKKKQAAIAMVDLKYKIKSSNTEEKENNQSKVA
jgi:hypothetical protein